MMLSRGLSRILATCISNGSTRACGLWRSTAALRRAATSTQRVAVVAPWRKPETGLCIEPETSGQTTM